METGFVGWPTMLSTIVGGGEIDRTQAAAAMRNILSGEASAAQIAAMLMGLRVRGERPDEMSGFVDAMLEAAAPLLLTSDDAVDIVGTGGSVRRRERALNVSTAASFVAAACGATVCKHGNRMASSTSGSTDVLEALGIGVELDGVSVARCVDEIGVGFAFARVFHPAMRFAGPVRAELGIPTLFNLLGPLSHPARLRRGVIGVGDPERFDLVVDTIARRDPVCVWVVHGLDGLDELSTSAPTRVVELRGDEQVEFELHPAQLGVVLAEGPIGGGSPSENAAIIEAAFAGVQSVESDLIAVNAAAALVVAGVADNVSNGVAAAREALASGAALAKLDALRALVANLD